MVKLCMCQACQYKRWWGKQQTRKKYGMKIVEPRPKVERDFHEHCNCRKCLKDRLRASNRRNKEYLEIIAELKSKAR